MRSGNLTDFWCTIGGCTKSKHTSQVLVQGLTGASHRAQQAFLLLDDFALVGPQQRYVLRADAKEPDRPQHEPYARQEEAEQERKKVALPAPEHSGVEMRLGVGEPQEVVTLVPVMESPRLHRGGLPNLPGRDVGDGIALHDVGVVAHRSFLQGMRVANKHINYNIDCV